MRMKRTGRSRVSAITKTPASAPFGPVTTPPMSSLSMVTACCACTEAGATQPTTAIPIAATPVKRILRIVMPLAVDGPPRELRGSRGRRSSNGIGSIAHGAPANRLHLNAGGENAPIPRLSIQDLQSQVGGIFETYFAQQHHIIALISGQTPGHS